jgi:hypothetical protein
MSIQVQFLNHLMLRFYKSKKKNFKIQPGDNFNFLPKGWSIWKVQVFPGASNLCRQKRV